MDLIRAQYALYGIDVVTWYPVFGWQVLAKASKVIPVMLMGKIVQSKTYDYWEYG